MVLLERITSGIDSTKFKVRLLDKTSVYHLVVNKCVKAVTVDTLYVSEEQELL